MANGTIRIETEEDFNSIKDDRKLWMIFNTLMEMRKNDIAHRVECDNRFCKIERRKKFDTALSGVTGVFGGFVAVIAKTLFRI